MPFRSNSLVCKGLATLYSFHVDERQEEAP